ncbi:MAG: hypothetical protein IPM99_18095 [Rubrivivax sp.]|nr:hypothetical protein [Rubrivivax sp.]
MLDGAEHPLSAAQYFAACVSAADIMAGAGTAGSPGLRVMRHDLAGCGATLLCVLPPAGCFWGLPCRGTDREREWADACSLEPAFVDALRALARGRGGLAGLPPAFAGGCRIVGGERDIEVGAKAADPPGSRLLPWLVATDVVPAACARLGRHIEQLGSFAALSAKASQGAGAEADDLWLSPKLMRLFAPDHGRGILGAASSGGALAALEDALHDLDESALRDELSPRMLAEETIRLRYPIPDPAAAPAGRRAGLAPSLFARAGAGPGELERVALLRAQLLRRLGWPTGVDLLRRTAEPRLHSAMLSGRPPWAALEHEVQALLQAARGRFPVLFES